MTPTKEPGQDMSVRSRGAARSHRADQTMGRLAPPSFAPEVLMGRGTVPSAGGSSFASSTGDLTRALATTSDIVARAQMSIQLQRTIGNARMADLMAPKTTTIPEPQVAPPRAIQAKREMSANRPGTSEEQRPNHTDLPDGLKSGIESLSGVSMDNVNVHYDSSQPAQLNALAYAQGSDVYVAPGQEHHLPHEAWHVVQQAQGRVQPTMQLKDGVPVNDDERLEHEADVMGRKSGKHHTAPRPRQVAGGQSTLQLVSATPARQAAAIQRQQGPDAGTPDAGNPNAGTSDASTPDAGTPDAGTPDAGTQPAPQSTAPPQQGAGGGSATGGAQADPILKFQQQMMSKPPDYDGAALSLNGMSDTDLKAEVQSVSEASQIALLKGAMRTMLLWPPPHRVADAIQSINQPAARQGLIDFFHDSLNRSEWRSAALALNGFNDADIQANLTSPPLTNAELVHVRYAALQYMAGWNSRIVQPIHDILQNAAANEMGSMVGQKATWVPSGPGSGNSFDTWASAPTESAAPQLQPATTINCWEMVLLAAFRAAIITWQWIHDIYTASGAATGGSWSNYLVRRLTPSGRQTYNRGSATGLQPKRGDIVFFNGAAHVTMSGGGRDGAGRAQVYSFWPPPGSPSVRNTVDAVKLTTVEELSDYMDAAFGGPTLVEFGAGPW